MTQERVERRLAAILAADMAGYSRLIGVDEAGTIARLKALREELIDPKIAEHDGRIVNTTGDGLLAEFASAVDAVLCAVEIQRAMGAREAEVPEDRRIAYRVGINLGEIVIDGEDILGDGVNVAARLEGIAEPGGIRISDVVYKNVKGKLDLGFADLGPQHVKNIAEPVPTYRVLLDPADSGKFVAAKRRPPTTPRWAAGAIAAVLMLAAGGLAWWRPWAPYTEPVRPERMAYPLPDKPSIAVLPFTNMSGDPEQDYFADGITEDLMTDLSKISGLFVIARNSSFAYKGRETDVRTIARELGVRYLLEGSVRRAGDSVRVNAQLIDATTGSHLWAERFDLKLADVFKLQDEVTGRIARTLNLELIEAESRRAQRGIGNLDAWDHAMRGWAIFMNRRNRNADSDAKGQFEKALALDPQSAESWTGMSLVHTNFAVFGRRDMPRPEALKRAREAGERAVALAPKDAYTHYALGYALRMSGQIERSIDEMRAAIALNRNHAPAYHGLGFGLMQVGRTEESLPWFEKALRLSPRDPAAAFWYWTYSLAQHLLGRDVEAAELARKAIAINPKYPWPHEVLASALAWQGQVAEAENTLADYLKLRPAATVSKVAARFPSSNKTFRAQFARFLDGLRKAGLAENPTLPLPDKPSIAVLPFTNMSGDPEQDYFADGMAEDIITDLSKISGLFVIARNSSFAYKGRATDVRAAARELGVKYVLEGSVRRAGDQVRINAQLIDATTGGHLWAERYDGTLADVFKLQDRVTAQIVASLSVTLNAGEQALAGQTETSVPEAYDAFLSGWRHFRARTVEEYRMALTWLEKAVALDPDYGRAWAALASLYLESFQRNWLGELGIDYARLPDLLAKALRRPTPLAYQVQAERLMMVRHFDEAEAALDKASALDPNDPDTYVIRSDLAAMQGDTDTAIALVKTAMRLDPHYPAFDLYILGTHYLRAGDFAKAIEFLERAQARNPEDWYHLLYLTAAYAEADRLDDAKEAAKALVQRRRGLGFPFTTVGGFSHWSVFKDAFGERIMNGLRKAGLRDQISAEDLNLSPEYRLTGAALRESLFCGCRHKGRAEGGVWMRDIYSDGTGIHYWQGSRTSTTTSEIRDDVEYSERSNGRRTECSFYRNPKGTKENLDEIISVCAHGVFPFAEFPLPETNQ